ncbi:hypothetical protein AeMF1_021780 [Aphanomyces euteiches]|nr:hypothetical protein AeMF1_021780 [Aphanomyces euteiches]
MPAVLVTKMTEKIGNIFKSKKDNKLKDTTSGELTTMLFDATSGQQDNPEVVRELIMHGANVNATDKGGNSPLYWASLRGHLNTVKELLANDARVNISNHRDETPLHKAVENGYLKIVVQLLNQNPNVNKETYENKTPLYWAVAKGNLDIVHVLLNKNAKASIPDENGDTPLFRATVDGNLDIVVAILGAPDASVNKANYAGETPLQKASKNGRLDIVKELLKHQIDVDVMDNDDITALGWASHHGHVGVVKSLLEHGAEVDTIDKDGSSPLIWAARFKYIDIVNQLLDKGAELDVADRRGFTALHWASDYGHLDVVQELVAHGSALGLADKTGWTPLHLAAWEGHVEIVKLLLDSGAETLVKTQKGQTARVLGNDAIKALIDDVELPINIQRATKRIRQALIDAEKRKLDSLIVASGIAIFRLCLQFEIQLENVLTTGLIVERIVRHILRCGPKNIAPTLISIMNDVKDHFNATITKAKSIRFHVDDIRGQGQIVLVGAEIVRLQDRLVHAAENLHINLNDQVVGTVNDLSDKVSETMAKINHIDNVLEKIANGPKERRIDQYCALEIELKKVMDYFASQVDFHNITHDEDFVSKIESCQHRIREIIPEPNFEFTARESILDSWIISSQDLVFDVSNSSLLGQGGFANVFKGTYQGRAVAVKQFDSILSTDSSDMENEISKEIKKWKNISSEPYILSLIGACIQIPRLLVVIELCQTNIRRYIRDQPNTLIPMIYQFALGLQKIHKANIVHGDLKADNVLVTFENKVAIADFGLSRTITSFASSTTTTNFTGTWNWTSPEQYLTLRNVTTKSDMWSFGMTIWEILCNDIPFKECSEDEFKQIFQTDNDRPGKPPNWEPKLDPLWNLIEKCWRLDPNDRPSISDVINLFRCSYRSQVESL